MNRLSHSSISKYLECNRKYRHHYVERVRPKTIKSALVFGGCVDEGLNALHQGKTIEEAKELFLKEWSKFETDKSMIYSKSDLDKELLKHFDINYPDESWWSMLYKGYLMLEACQREVLPLIKEHIAVQKNITFKNDAGDEIVGILDLIIKSKDDKIYLMDNKTSSVKYTDQSPKESQQLVLYYYIEKDSIPIDECGFFVYNKKINMQRVKKCKKCGTINESSHKTCNAQELVSQFVNDKNELVTIRERGSRCNGEFEVTYNPIAEVDVITNVITPEDEERVINDIDRANEGITNKEFEPNFEACEGKFGKCEYYKLCHESSVEGLKIEKKES